MTYYWPPAGGAGVQRWLKFSKYLPQSDWEPVILTIDPEYATYPAQDPSLLNDVPDGLKIHRIKATDWFRLYSKDKSKVPTAGFAKNNDDSLRGKLSRFIRGNFFIPDPRRGWNRFAVKEALKIIRTENINIFITTSPPHSSQLIGLRIKKMIPEIKWIADLRDPWTDIYYYDLFYPTYISRSLDKHYEKKVLQKADRIITVGHNLAEIFAAKTGGIKKKINVIPNGYDEEDFKGINYGFPERFTITYTGTLSEVYPVDNLLNALTLIEKNGSDFLLQFVGFVSEEIITKINKCLKPDKVRFITYTDHAGAISCMAGSSLLLLIIPGHKKNDSITTGKVFEYFACRKPVLYIGPAGGDAEYHLKICGQSGIFNGQSSEDIRSFIEKMMKNTERELFAPHPEYSRRNQTKDLSKILQGM